MGMTPGNITMLAAMVAHIHATGATRHGVRYV